MADMKLRELQHLVDSKIIKYAHEFNIANDFRELSKQIDMLAEEQSNPAIEAQEAEIKRLQDDVSVLWMLLDDIDTLDDGAKDNDALFRKACYKIQQKRWKIKDPFFMDKPH